MKLLGASVDSVIRCLMNYGETGNKQWLIDAANALEEVIKEEQ